LGVIKKGFSLQSLTLIFPDKELNFNLKLKLREGLQRKSFCLQKIVAESLTRIFAGHAQIILKKF
jgi:hypothetical protein